MKRRVVITGIGAVTPYGIGADKYWEGIISGKSCIGYTEGIDDRNIVKISGQIKDFVPEDYIDVKECKRMDRYVQLATVAADEAIADSKIKDVDIDPYRVGVIVSSAAGGFTTLEKSEKIILEKGPVKVSPFTIPMLISNMSSGKISIRHGFKGINKVVISACATGTHSIGDSFRSIQYGEADVMIAGGSDAIICDLGVGSFSVLRALSKRNDEPEKASRPYDKDRDGFVLSEGAGVLVLEEYEHAKKRGAHIYAEIVGYGQTADAYDMVAPDPNGVGAVKSMEFALKDAGIEPKDVQYINTHGTSTGLGDKGESLAVQQIFGSRKENPNLYVSSTKSMHGHLLGASGAVESIACVRTLMENIVPPTINLDNQDEEVADLNYVPHKAQKVDVHYAMSNSFGFGGHNGTLIFKEYNE